MIAGRHRRGSVVADRRGSVVADRRGSVTVIAAIMASVMVMTMAMAIEVTYWSVNQTELQRIADAAAYAAANNYLNASSPSISAASTVGKNVALLNGIASGNVTVAQATAVKTAGDVAFKATVSRVIAQSFSAIFNIRSTSGTTAKSNIVTISASAIAELVPPTSPQPCLLALAPASAPGAANTMLGISMTGAADISASKCTIVSNADIDFEGATKINSAGTYSTVQWTTDQQGAKPITGGFTINPSAIPDPYANTSVIQNALNSLTGGGSPDPSLYNGKSASIGPGTYQGLTVGQGTLNMSAGTYYVNGNVVIGGSGASTVNGTGVSIIASGYFQLTGGSTMNVTAPQLNATSGIAGVVFASRSTAVSQIDNGVTPPSKGLFYYPNGQLTMAGSVPGSSDCNTYIAYNFSITGTSTFTSTCTGRGLTQFHSTPDVVALVE